MGYWQSYGYPILTWREVKYIYVNFILFKPFYYKSEAFIVGSYEGLNLLGA